MLSGKLKVAIRVDSSTAIGSGHLMRCLTLADRMRKEKNAEVHFVSRDLEGNLYGKIREKGFFLHVLPRYPLNESLTGYAAWLTVSQNVDAAETKAVLQEIGKVNRLVVDNYALDITWERDMRPFTDDIFVIDDLANRKHDCDILLEQGFRFNQESRYLGLVPAHCKLLLGPAHALLREEFYEVKAQARKRMGTIGNILVFYGGSDLTGETEKAIYALERIALSNVQVHVVVGSSNRRKEIIRVLCERQGFFYYEQVDNMAEMMNEADLMLGAGGGTALERCFLKLPSIVTATAENQREGCECCAQLGLSEYLGFYDEVSVDLIVEKLRSMGKKELMNMAENCAEVFHCGCNFDSEKNRGRCAQFEGRWLYES